jgi:transposase-like protein|tara:strand:+ start:618 stop:815 length:198 start_codon:yes stop_codon:yes gene_type:complete
MKNYNIKRWVCDDCAWDWNTLAVGNTNEECPACNSFNVRESIVSAEADFLEEIEEEFAEELKTDY